jgi:hypothetical protein
MGNPRQYAVETFKDTCDVGLFIVGRDDDGQFQDARLNGI